MSIKNTERERLLIHEILKDILESNNVYYQPPMGARIEYDCIVYELANIIQDYADNGTFVTKRMYRATYISRTPINDIPEAIMRGFRYSSFDRQYISDNLYHTVITIGY